MPRQRVDVPAPIGGIDRNWAFRSQPPATCREGPNMRGIDPVTGRTRGAQRPGTGKFYDDTGALVNGVSGLGRVQSLTPITYDIPTETHVINSSDAAAHIFAAPITEEWLAESASGNDFLAMVVERGGGVIALDTEGTFTRYSADGEKKDSGVFPKLTEEKMFPQLLLDQLGGLVGAVTLIEADIETTRVFRMREVEDEGWRLHWEFTLEGQAAGLSGTFGTLHIAVNFLPLFGATLTAGRVYQYGEALTSLPAEIRQIQTPGPIGGIDLGLGGAIYVTITENSERDTSTTGYLPSVVDWTPLEILDQTRLYLWWSNDVLRDTVYTPFEGTGTVRKPRPEVHGDPHNTLIDRRVFEPSPFPSDFFVGRSLSLLLEGATSNAIDDQGDPPLLDLETLVKPSMRFGQNVDGDPAPTSRESGASESVQPGDEVPPGKETKTSSNGAYRALFPGYDGAIFTTYLVVRGVRSTTTEMLFQQSLRNQTSAPAETPVEYGMLLNAASISGNILLEIEGAEGFAAGGPAIATGSFSTHGFLGDDPRDTVVITIQHSGITLETGEVSCFRVNGQQIDHFDLTLDQSASINGGEVRTHIGYAERDIGTPDDEKYTVGEAGGFTGWLCEALTVLAEHGAGVNDIHSVVPVGPHSADPQSLPGNFSGTVNAENRADASEMEYIEGYLAHRWGIADALPNGLTESQDGQTTNPITGPGFWNNHPFGGAANTPGFGTGAPPDTSGALASPDSITAKYYADGRFAWSLAGSGMGRAVKFFLDKDDRRWVYTCGSTDNEPPNQPNDGAGNAVVRRILDEGPSFSIDQGDDAWLAGSNLEVFDSQIPYPMGVMSNGDVWTSGDLPSGFGDIARNRMRRFASSDDPAAPGGFYQAAHIIVFPTPGGEQGRRVNGFAFDPDEPFYGQGEARLGEKSMYIVLDGSASLPGQLIKLKILQSDPIPDAVARRTQVVAVRGGTVSLFDRGDTNPIPTGGSNAIDPAAIVQAAVLFGKMYFVDGTDGYKLYDPFGDIGDTEGVVEDWEAEEGAIPRRAQLIAPWRGRLVLARFVGRPYAWAMSRILDPLDWNDFPDVVTVDQAVTGLTAPQAADIPDVVNALIPYNDDLLIFGCDSSFYRLTGDPMANGQIDLLSDITGIAFGTPFVKDPSGVLYFFGSHGGVYAMSGGGSPVSLTDFRIDRDLQDIDLSQFRVDMQWSERHRGLHVFVISRTDGTVTRSWFWDHKNNGWWEDTFAQPVTATCVFNGDDPGDRRVLLGSEDGHVRELEESLANDDGSRIDSSLLLGPFSGPSIRALFSRLDVTLDFDQGGCTYEIYVGENPAQFGAPIHEGTFLPGFNAPHIFRISGNHLWLRLRNATLDRWALESMAMFVAPFGSRRTYGG